MKKNNNKCPICGKHMNHVNADSICPECGYHTSYEAKNWKRPTGNTNSRTPSQPGTIHYSYNEDHAASSRPAANPKKQKHIYRNIGIAAILVGIFFAIGFQIPSLFRSISDTYQKFSESGQGNQNKNSQTTNNFSLAQPKPSTYKKKDTSKSHLPESRMFRQFISHVFDKTYQTVSLDELAQIRSLHIYNNEQNYLVIHYVLQDSHSGEFYFNNDSVKSSDLKYFVGLESLNLEDDSLSQGDLDGLKKLRKLHCGNSPKELSNIIVPRQLTELGIDSDLFLSGLDGIEAFTNLSSLSLNSRHLEDLSPLSSLKKLKKLEISHGDSIEEFSILYKMNSLQSLSIDSKKLRDIGFISNMPALKELSIHNSNILQVDALADRQDTLQKLDLSENYAVENYQVISCLNKLTDLTLFVSYSFENPIPLPELGNMPELTRLSISNYDDISQIANAPGLQELTMTGDYAHDFSPLAKLSHLTCLNLLDMSLEPSAFEAIMGLTQLEKINLNDSFIWGNSDGLLQLPHLKEFNLNNCTTGFDVNNLTNNNSLEILHMNHVTLKALENGKWDYQANNENNFSLADHTDIFLHYPNLKELYVAENKLTDLNFAKDLKHLKLLDITNNYVTNLTPLSDLAELETIQCAQNALANDGGLENKILTKN